MAALRLVLDANADIQHPKNDRLFIIAEAGEPFSVPYRQASSLST
ncbi:hypothetical protein [Mesorhizobium sp.]|nr:hypothetical protein [Mesorhizobium sp.]